MSEDSELVKIRKLMEGQQDKASRRKTLIVVGALLTLIALTLYGVLLISR